MKKNGIVVETKGSKVVLLTDNGEFALVKASSILPIKGEVYEGNIISSQNTIKRLAVLAATFLMIFTFGIIDYYNPVKAVELDANSKILIQANRWNRVVRVKTDDENLKMIMNKINVNNMNLGEAIKGIISEIKSEKLIESYGDINIKSVKGNVDISSVGNDIKELEKTELDKNNKQDNKDNNNSIDNKPSNQDNIEKKEHKSNNEINNKPNNEIEKSNKADTNSNNKDNGNSKSNESIKDNKDEKSNKESSSSNGNANGKKGNNDGNLEGKSNNKSDSEGKKNK